MSESKGKTDTAPRWASPHGNRYTCWSCGVKFYDLGKSPVVCPGCGANQDEEPALLERKVGRASRSRVEIPPIDEDVVTLDGDDELDTEDLDDLDVGDDEGEDVVDDDEDEG